MRRSRRLMMANFCRQRSVWFSLLPLATNFPRWLAGRRKLRANVQPNLPDSDDMEATARIVVTLNRSA